MYASTKCKKCRQLLFDEGEVDAFVNAHSELFVDSCDKENCPSIEELICVTEERLPDWIKSSVEEKHWSKGKINCKHCGARIGSFDFISGSKCVCRNYVLPAVRITKSKVDLSRRSRVS